VTDKPLTIIALDRVTMRAEVPMNEDVHAWLQSCAEIMDREVSRHADRMLRARNDLTTFGAASVHLPDGCWAPNNRWALRALARHSVTKPVSD
jgi:hypothetical protein